MEEWRLTRWHAQARLHFLGKIANYAGPNLLGGNEKLVAVMAQILEKLDMLKPPRATDLRISTFGKEIIPDDLKRGKFDELTAQGARGWRASGSALSSGRRSADAVVLGVQNAAGEWVAIAAATPVSPLQYLARGTQMDFEFLAVSDPQKRGKWQINLPIDAFGAMQEGVLRAWAMDFPRRILYRLPGDKSFTKNAEPNKPSDEPLVQTKDASPP